MACNCPLMSESRQHRVLDYKMMNPALGTQPEKWITDSKPRQYTGKNSSIRHRAAGFGCWPVFVF